MAVQVRPSGEPTTAGLMAAAVPVVTAEAPPTASHPDGPCATPASCPAPAPPAAGGVRAPRCQVEPPSAETHSAQPRFALPTATSVAPSAAIADDLHRTTAAAEIGRRRPGRRESGGKRGRGGGTATVVRPEDHDTRDPDRDRGHQRAPPGW